MLSLARHHFSSSSSLMMNTPVISPSTLRDDPFKSALVNAMQTPDVIDFSLSFAPMTVSATTPVPTTPVITTSQTYHSVHQSPSTTSNINLATPQPSLLTPQPLLTPRISLFPSSGDHDHDNMLLDLSPRIRNQITGSQRAPAFPQNVSSLSVPNTMSMPTHTSHITSTNVTSTYDIYQPQPQYSESALQFNQDFLVPASVSRQSVSRNVTSTVSRPTDTSVTSYDFGLSSRDDMFSSDSNTVEYFHETTDRNIYTQFAQRTRSPSPDPIPGSSSSLSDFNEDRHPDRYNSLRLRNNRASKKFRSSRRDQQKDMEKQIKYYIDDNQRCHKLIAQMEKEIESCKQILFKNFKKN